MHRFLQLHLLTSYPPSNLNRDDLGRPKTAVMGDAQRLRISSQSLKRAWRKSEVFEEAVGDHIGTRTKEMGRRVYNRLTGNGVKHGKAIEWSQGIAEQFGALKTLSAAQKKERSSASPERKKKLDLITVEIEQLAHFSPEEQRLVEELADNLDGESEGPTEEDLELLRKDHKAVDIALFGRMLAAKPIFNVEAAAQVAHAISVHRSAVEDDFFTAVDDLNTREEDLGAGHMGATEFAAGLFYLYICVDRRQLLENLQNDTELTNNSIAALIDAAATVAPSGKQNSFASRARASYILCETGGQQPRSLSVAFLKPVTGTGEGMLANTINALKETRTQMDKAYGPCADADPCEMNLATGEGTLAEILACARV